MNKRKRVAWHKHLKKAQKAAAKAHAGRTGTTGFAGTPTRAGQATGAGAPRR